MPKTRTLEPEFWDDTVMDSLPIPERLLAAAMITLLADDEGRFIAEPSVVKKKVFGADNSITIADVDSMLVHIASSWRNLKLYVANGQRYGWLANFQAKQGIRYVVKSKLPPFDKRSQTGLPPDKAPEINDSSTLPKSSADSPSIGLSRVGLSSTRNPSSKDSRPSQRRERRPRTFTDDSREMRAARYLFSKIRENNPKAKQPNLQSWAAEFDRIFRIDRRDRNDIRAAINFSQSDPFWLTTILSPANLRKHFDRFVVAQSHSPPKSRAIGEITSAPSPNEK